MRFDTTSVSADSWNDDCALGSTLCFRNAVDSMELACKTHRNNQESVVLEKLSHSLSDDGGDHSKQQQQQAVVHSLSEDGGDRRKQLQVVEVHDDDDDGHKKLLQEEGDGDGDGKEVLRNAWVSMEHYCKVADGKRMMVVESPPGDCCMR